MSPGAPSRRQWPLAVAGAAALAASACGQDTTAASLRALDVSGEISTLCLGRDEDNKFTRGFDRFECPDFRVGLDQKRMHALVTQPISGEVALVDLATSASAAVVDFEPTQPGFSFMPVGGEPGAIVSTQGGVASFVGVREPGREGIFALPSSCIAPRPDSAPLRDVRTWPACRLPAAPGPMIILQDPFVDADSDPLTPPVARALCDGDYVDPELLVGVAPAASRAECPADLATETRTRGRQKIAVALPSLSEIWILDAQELLDRPLGSFDACRFEHRAALAATMPTSSQRLPPDLVPSSPSCMPIGYEHGPVPDAFSPFPVDFALDDEGRLFVADSDAPAIHVLDATNPCALSSLPPLEPLSLLDPGAVITTRRLAVSPLTPSGRRFVYAIDNSATRTAGSLMAFDVSPGSTDRTPIVRERSPFNPSEPPDRIVLPRDVADVEFVFQDSPQPATGVAVEGIACDPHPELPEDDPAALYRPRSDSTAGAGASPRTLRGTFAFAALHSGQVSVIDVEDLDAACRRPYRVRHEATEDIAGCSNDDPSVPADPGYSVQGAWTVSGELSCNVVAPHRPRSRSFFTNASGTARSAGLLSFPTLTLDTGRSVATDQSDEGRDQPKLLAARHVAGQEEALYVGPLEYRTDDPADDIDDPTNRLDVDPAVAERSSLLLSYEEPRAFFPGEDFIATYEGVVRATSQASFTVDDAGFGIVNEGLNASFCTAGIQDEALTREVGGELGLRSEADRSRFARRHADYVQITGALLERDDEYWRSGEPGAECGSELFEVGGGAAGGLAGYTLCEQFFGPPEVPTPSRDLRIVEASEDGLLVEPRTFNPLDGSVTRRRHLASFVSCCFPRPTNFQVRAGHQWVVRGAASGAPHHVTADPQTGRCVNDCSPLFQRQTSRVFELACSDCGDGATSAVGPARAADDTPLSFLQEDFVCVVDAGTLANGIDPGEPGSECVFQNLTTRFALYRGLLPSERDMRFRWQLSDGFTPLSIPLTNNLERRVSSPRSLLLIPETNQMVVSDGSTRGIAFITPRNTQSLVSIY